MAKLNTEDLCYVSNVNAAANITGEPFAVVTCDWYTTCTGLTQYIDPATNTMLELKYCKLNPVVLGVTLGILALVLLIMGIMYVRNRGGVKSFMQNFTKQPDPSFADDEDDDIYDADLERGID